MIVASCLTSKHKKECCLPKMGAQTNKQVNAQEAQSSQDTCGHICCLCTTCANITIKSDQKSFQSACNIRSGGTKTFNLTWEFLA